MRIDILGVVVQDMLDRAIHWIKYPGFKYKGKNCIIYWIEINPMDIDGVIHLLNN